MILFRNYMQRLADGAGGAQCRWCTCRPPRIACRSVGFGSFVISPWRDVGAHCSGFCSDRSAASCLSRGRLTCLSFQSRVRSRGPPPASSRLFPPPAACCRVPALADASVLMPLTVTVSLVSGSAIQRVNCFHPRHVFLPHAPITFSISLSLSIILMLSLSLSIIFMLSLSLSAKADVEWKPLELSTILNRKSSNTCLTKHTCPMQQL